MKIKSLLLLPSLLLLLACTDDERNIYPAPESTVVERTFEVTALPMQWADGSPQTRSAMTAAETGIHTLHFVQFDGVEETSTVCHEGEVALVNGKITLKLLPYNISTRVYLLANMGQTGVQLGVTTLAEFENMSVAFAPTATLDATKGLPMSDFADFIPMDVYTTPAFALTALVAKVSVKMSIDPAIKGGFSTSPAPTIYLLNAASATTLVTSGDPATAHRPQGCTFVPEIEVGAASDATTYTYYVAENRAGRNALVKKLTQRSVENAQPDALCFELRGKLVSNVDVILSLFGGESSVVSDFNVKRNCAYTLTGTLTGLNGADERLLMYENLSANATANCYIVTENNRGFAFDATKRGNNNESSIDPNVSSISYHTLPDLRTATQARVIWQTGIDAGRQMIDPSLVRLLRGKVVFNVTDNVTEGNAVIGLFASSAADAECLWSWHIWKLDSSAPSTVTCTKTSATTGADTQFQMMDRNLGAYNNTPGDVRSIGLFYQWGRKDPFPGPAGFNTSELSNIYGSYNNGGSTGTWTGTYSCKTSYRTEIIGTEAWAVKYPTAFIERIHEPYDWMAINNNSLWGTPWIEGGTGGYNKNQGTKSIYDPCPVGYRVPPHDTWSKQTSNGTFRDNGMVLGSVATDFWFPAAGDRIGGSLGKASEHGDYWSSSSSEFRSYWLGCCLFFMSNGNSVYPKLEGSKVAAYSVRCVAE